VETASNSTTEQDACVRTMTDKQLTVRLYEMLKAAQPVTISAKLPTIDDARAIIAVDFQESGDDWKAKGAKNAV